MAHSCERKNIVPLYYSYCFWSNDKSCFTAHEKQKQNKKNKWKNVSTSIKVKCTLTSTCLWWYTVNASSWEIKIIWSLWILSTKKIRNSIVCWQVWRFFSHRHKNDIWIASLMHKHISIFDRRRMKSRATERERERHEEMDFVGVGAFILMRRSVSSWHALAIASVCELVVSLRHDVCRSPILHDIVSCSFPLRLCVCAYFHHSAVCI